MKRLVCMIAVVMLAFTMCILTSCGSGVIGVSVTDEKTASIQADKATEDMVGGAGTLVIEKGQKLVVEPKMEGDGTVTVRLVGTMGEDADASDLENVSDADAAFEEAIGGTEIQKFDVPAGDYYVIVKGGETKATGTIELRVE